MKRVIHYALAFVFLTVAGVAAETLNWAALEQADVVIIGEVHDNRHHHLNQAEIIRRLAPAAVVFEMVPQNRETALAGIPPDRRTEAGLADLLSWSKRGWPDLAIYWPVFAAVGGAAIYGAEQPRPAVRAAYEDGAAASFGEGAARFGLDLALPDDQRARREADQLAAHCDALPPEALPGMVEAQRFRDAHLADAVLRAVAATGGQVVLITGNGHARTDQGVPALLRIAAPDLSVFSVGQFEEEAPEDNPFDDFLITDAVERPDPCEAFLKRDN